jgi:hypothetical protein
MNLEESKVLMNIEKYEYHLCYLPLVLWFWAFIEKEIQYFLLHLEADLLGDLFI